MPRSTSAWVGKTDDSVIPPRVRLRVWERCEGRCHKCQRKIPVGDKWILEHLIALINGGANAEPNLCLTCSWCKPIKDAEDVAEKAKTYAVKSKHLLPRKRSRLQSRGFPKAEPQRTATTPLSRNLRRTQ
jgi:5-methylcytosine-specific restriction endonuclease McrA